MRIAIWHNLPSGGGKRSLQYQVRGLLSRGHNLKVWTTPLSNQNFADIRPYVQEVVVPLQNRIDGNRWRYRGRRSIGHVLGKIDGIIDHCEICTSQIESQGFDILFAHSCTLFRATPIGGLCRLPSLIYQHEPFRWLYEALPELPWPAPTMAAPRIWPPQEFRATVREWSDNYAKRIQARAELNWIRDFTCVGVNSLFSRESVLRAYGLESKVMYLGVDTNIYQPSSPTKVAYVVGLGSIYIGKGVERAIDAIGTIPLDRRPPLIWIGNFSDAEYESKIGRQAKNLGVDFRVRVMVDEKELCSLLSSAACMIYTSRLEPFGLAPLEACACGTAVVGIAEGGIRESVTHGINGFLVSSDNSVELGKYVVSFTENLKFAFEMGKVARQHVMNNWNWNDSVATLEAALNVTVAAAGGDMYNERNCISSSAISSHP